MIIVGQQNVGKTALAYNFVNGQFKHDYNVTVGVQFSTKTIEIQDATIQIQIWDTVTQMLRQAGLEAFSSIVRTFYKGACAVLLVFAINNISSFEALKHWSRQVKEHAHQSICIFLVGTKLDLQNKRQVDHKQAEKFLMEIGGSYYVETSSKTSQNILQLFEKIANLMYKKYRVSAQFRQLVNPDALQQNEIDSRIRSKRTTSFSLRRLPSKDKGLPIRVNNCC